jgi:3-hydroxyacyl-CoA dehydrogenase/enoyl-CoA hydratase/3-hydroxybutyryl-CoA epimerase
MMAKTSSSPAPSLSLELRADGVAVVTFDTPGSSVNVLSRELVSEVERALATEDEDRAAVLVSGSPARYRRRRPTVLA